ncbi:hypothetical protein J2W98_003771 [Paenibacillus peoriae]|uniref:Uncharacterized protein n=1 Tax=Paenibacillus peoriae TaxID=59893 RepID=A0ABU1QIM4_9BACL|nr:hypothetical protein [Paenibacillus peoriae]MDR6779491.1 hypothetical protein [Paenibacillus peoriae]
MILENKRYYHKEYCYERFKKEQEATRIENEQWDDLYQYVIKLHDIVVLPKGNITRLKDLRAGFDTRGNKRERKWRSGPDYGLILDAYKLAEGSVKWCITNKLKGENDTRAINYGISIMINKLNEAFAKRKSKIRQQEYIDINKDNDTYEVEEIAYKPKIHQINNSISDFL